VVQVTRTVNRINLKEGEGCTRVLSSLVLRAVWGLSRVRGYFAFRVV